MNWIDYFDAAAELFTNGAENKPPTVVFLMGPTASGKTALAIELVKQFPFEIISVDSAMVYREMNIGTAKPDSKTLSMAPHRLINICDPCENYSAGQFRTDALREITDILKEGRIPLLVGGTMLYFRALEHGLAVLPAADNTVRAELSAEMTEKGSVVVHHRLAEVDPIAAARIHPNDSQRIQRALEVYHLTGQSLTKLLCAQKHTPLPFRVIKWVITPTDRQELHERISSRFYTMLDQGFVDEVKQLRARGDLKMEMPSMRAVGYRHVWAYLDGVLREKEMIERGIIATRQFAKRQLTWLRGELKEQ